MDSPCSPVLQGLGSARGEKPSLRWSHVMGVWREPAISVCQVTLHSREEEESYGVRLSEVKELQLNALEGSL